LQHVITGSVSIGQALRAGSAGSQGWLGRLSGLARQALRAGSAGSQGRLGRLSGQARQALRAGSAGSQGRLGWLGWLSGLARQALGAGSTGSQGRLGRLSGLTRLALRAGSGILFWGIFYVIHLKDNSQICYYDQRRYVRCMREAVHNARMLRCHCSRQDRCEYGAQCRRSVRWTDFCSILQSALIPSRFPTQIGSRS
jgi:hypothetical protein